MYLFIHAAERENSFLTLVGKSKEFSKNKESKESKELFKFLTFGEFLTFTQRLASHRGAGYASAGKKSPDVLRGIDTLLKKFNVKPCNLKGICVLSGPGQFSFLRSSIVIANTFGWTLHIPVVGVYGSDDMSEIEFLKNGIAKLSRAKQFRPIAPKYGKEPNITKHRARMRI